MASTKIFYALESPAPEESEPITLNMVLLKKTPFQNSEEGSVEVSKTFFNIYN